MYVYIDFGLIAFIVIFAIAIITGKSFDMYRYRHLLEYCCAFKTYSRSERSMITDRIRPLNKALPEEYRINVYEIDAFISVYKNYRSWLLSGYIDKDIRFSRIYQNILSSRHSSKSDSSHFREKYRSVSHHECFFAQTMYEYFYHNIKEYDSHSTPNGEYSVAHKMYLGSILMLSILGRRRDEYASEMQTVSEIIQCNSSERKVPAETPSKTTTEVSSKASHSDDSQKEKSTMKPLKAIYAKAANGMTVRVPIDKLKQWQEAQAKLAEKQNVPEDIDSSSTESAPADYDMASPPRKA